MKLISTLVAVFGVSAGLALPAFAAGKTCCEKAKAEGKICAHKCCLVATKAGKVCEKCNPKQKPATNKPGGQNK